MNTVRARNKPTVKVLGLASLAMLGCAQAFADSVEVSCAYSFGNAITSNDLYAEHSMSVSCANAQFGTLTSSAYVDGTKLGAYVGMDWNTLPPAHAPDEYVATARAYLIDTLIVPGEGVGTMTIKLPVHGTSAESNDFNLLTLVGVQTGSESGPYDAWSKYYESETQASFDDLNTITLSIPLGQKFPIFAQIVIWGGNERFISAYQDAYADFFHTAEISVTRLQDATGADIPLSSLTADSARQFAAVTPVPEPATGLLWAAGLAGLLLRRRCSVDRT
ncbi:MAG TPA: PEP-CTERM sorting domain-containing protein [Methyloversatilis sp.]